MRKFKKVWIQKYKRINYSKAEVRLILLKSVKFNKNIKNSIRAFAYSNIIKLSLKYDYKKYTQTCSISGKSRGV